MSDCLFPSRQSGPGSDCGPEHGPGHGRFLFTSAAASKGHPDKVADQVSDAVLDAILAEDPYGRVACETMVSGGTVILAGEITTQAQVDYTAVARETVRQVGYTDDALGISADNCTVLTLLGQQTPDIAVGVDEDPAAGKPLGAGDQGLMFGYASSDTPERLPLPIALAQRIMDRLDAARTQQEVGWLHPGGQAQVTVEYDQRRPVRIDTVAVSVQHILPVSLEDVRRFIMDEIVVPCLPQDLLHGNVNYHINAAGPMAARGVRGLTGRKIIADTYGGWGRHGGGAFSGKDPTKVDRSAAYMARHIAKNIVAAGLAERCEVQLAYAIGVAEPVSIHVDTQHTGRIDGERICRLVKELFPLSPAGIIDYLHLRRPIYRKLAGGCHFGRNDPDFTWECVSRAAELAEAVNQKQ